MKKAKTYYTEALERYVSESEKVGHRLKLLSRLRLLSFVLALVQFYFLWNNVFALIITSILVLGLFLFFLKKYENTKNNYRYLHHLVKINSAELKALAYDFSEFDAGSEYIDLNHVYSHDLDLFGQDSFFQSLNRTIFSEGKDFLASIIKANDIEAIAQKQETVYELSCKPDWRQDFTATAMSVHQETSISAITSWLSRYKPFVPSSMKYMPWLFLATFLSMAIVGIFFSWALNLAFLVFGLGLVVTGRFYKPLMQLAVRADKAKKVFRQYSQLFLRIESQQFDSEMLKRQQALLIGSGHKASKSIADFSKLLDLMDYNNNIFYALFGNGCALGALATGYAIEKWIQKHKSEVPTWFRVISFFEAYNSLGNFSFNHQAYNFPKIVGQQKVLKAKSLGHPMLVPNKNVTNTIEINTEEFLIITGSNMAGKSTFLRSVGLCVVMANLGLPVNASDCAYGPIKLISSMRSIDSLQKGDSYFLSELKRLKVIVESIEKDSYFVLLDEILRGTNSVDKANGSKRFLARLINEKATGLIATHDLSLCDMADATKGIYNYHFDAAIVDDELHFDYKLHRGISKTMNATFLLEKMDLV